MLHTPGLLATLLVVALCTSATQALSLTKSPFFDALATSNASFIPQRLYVVAASLPGIAKGVTARTHVGIPEEPFYRDISNPASPSIPYDDILTAAALEGYNTTHPATVALCAKLGYFVDSVAYSGDTSPATCAFPMTEPVSPPSTVLVCAQPATNRTVPFAARPLPCVDAATPE